MRVKTAAPHDMAYVALTMRASDLREFEALHPVTGREALAARLCRLYGHRTDFIAACGDDGTAIGIGALIEARPNVVTLTFYATDALGSIARTLTKFIRDNLFVRLKAAGVHRIECVSIDGHREAHRWIQMLGLDLEAECPGYGKNGEKFLQFAWVAEDVRKASARVG